MDRRERYGESCGSIGAFGESMGREILKAGNIYNSLPTFPEIFNYGNLFTFLVGIGGPVYYFQRIGNSKPGNYCSNYPVW
jgi:hypothetical protein